MLPFGKRGCWLASPQNLFDILCGSCFLSALYLKVTILFNINFASPSHHTRHIRWEGEQIFGFFFFLKRLYGYCSVANHANLSAHVQIYADFKIFFYFCLRKNRNKMKVYEYEKFFLTFPHIFSKTTLGLYFYKLYKFMKYVIIVFSTYLNFIKFLNTSTIFWKASTKF